MPNIQCNKSSLGHLPVTERWVFDESVTSVFPDMLRRSIPQYEVMRQAVFDLGRRVVLPATSIVDLGCSTGDSLGPFVEHFAERNRYLGVEVAAPMLAVSAQRFASEIAAGMLQLLDMDLRLRYPDVQASLTLCVLTLQFIPLEYRQRILRAIYASTLPGGALIVVEKLSGTSAHLHQHFSDLYLAHKSANGYSQHEITSKQCALENVLVPLTAPWNAELLRAAGFADVEVFWRWMNFAGFIALK